jgi:hypothetical protein
MNMTLTEICGVPGTGSVMRAPRVDARLAPGGPERRWEPGTRSARSAQAGESSRWQPILDLLDPDKCCGSWSPATCKGRPVVCTRAPHDAGEEHASAETGWRWSNEES